MIKTLQNSLYLITHLMLAFVLNACDGDVLFRTKSCEEGMVRQGSACVAATKAGMGECKDVDLSKLQKGETITMCDGSRGEGKLSVPSDCAQDGEQNCIAKLNFKVVNLNNFSSSEIKIGRTIAGVSGSLRGEKHCRNYSALSLFDSTYVPTNLGWNLTTFLPAAVNTGTDQITFTGAHGLTTNSLLRFTSTTTLPAPLVAGTTYYAIYISATVIQLASVANGTQIDITSQGTGTHTAHDIADNVAQYYDTIDDDNYGQAIGPTNNPWSTNDYLCDATNFVNITSTSAPLLPSGLTPPSANQAFTQIWQDQISGMYISNILFQGSGANWSKAIRICESLNGGTAGEGWRLPTQKELLQFYLHGIAKAPLAGGGLAGYFWSSTGVSGSTFSAWTVSLSLGDTSSSNRSQDDWSVLCTR